MKTVTMVLVAILWLGTSVSSQGVTADEYPSEDELLEALQLGEIDEVQYQRLREILCADRDSSTAEMLDDLPDADAVLRLFGLNRADLFPPAASPQAKPTVRIADRYERKVTDEDESRYRLSLDVDFTSGVTANVRIDRTFSGRERIVARRVRYRSRHRLLRELTVGTYAHRLGLGTVSGYRGQLFDCSPTLNIESFRFPDYGGANGVYVRMESGQWQVTASGSIRRDQIRRLSNATVMLEHSWNRTDLGLLGGVTGLSNRSTGAGMVDVKPGVYLMHRYAAGKMASEISAQAGERNGFGAIVVEGNHRNGSVELKYDVWSYSQSYIDLNAGSRSGPLSRRDSLTDVEFSFSTRRRGAHGGRLRSSVELDERTALENDCFVHAFNADTVRLDYTTALVRDPGRKLGVRIEYRFRFTRRNRGSPGDQLREGRGLAQVEFSGGRLRGKVYLAHSTRENQTDYLTMLTRWRLDTPRLGRIEFGSNLARGNLRPIRNDYWSAYLRTVQALSPNLSWAVRLTHRYSRSSSMKHETTVAFEMEGGI